MKWKILIYMPLLLLTFFLPFKTADYMINKDTTKKEVTKEKEWVEKSIVDTTDIEEIPITETESTQKEEVVTESSNWWEYPDEIFETTRSGDDLLVLVNKQYKLPSTYAPKDLVLASTSGIRRGENYSLRKVIIEDLKKMINDSKDNGIDLSIVSAYRSYQTQVDTYNYWLNKNNNDVEYVDTFSARPGHSQHQLGTTLDFSTNEIGDALGDSFANTKAGKWLAENAYKYGFMMSYPKGYESITGYKFESWHYRYIGVFNATEAFNQAKTLELYLRGYNL